MVVWSSYNDGNNDGSLDIYLGLSKGIFFWEKKKKEVEDLIKKGKSRWMPTQLPFHVAACMSLAAYDSQVGSQANFLTPPGLLKVCWKYCRTHQDT